MASKDVTFTNSIEEEPPQPIVPLIKYTFRDLPEDTHKQFPYINLDSELPLHLYQWAIPKTVGEFLKRTNYYYSFINPKDALAYFLTDSQARIPSIIKIKFTCTPRARLYSCLFTTTFDTKTVRGYSDYERILNFHSPMNEELFNAIIASSARKFFKK